MTSFETNLQENFARNFVGMWRSHFTAIGFCFEMSVFTVQGKAMPSFFPPKIIESCLEWKGPSQIGQELRLPKQTIAKILDIFVSLREYRRQQMKKYQFVCVCRMM